MQNLEELDIAIQEMQNIINVSSLDQFLTDSILRCIQVVEGVSTYTKYDISGCAEALKQNKEFLKVCKMLYIKYNVFTKLPPEYQLVMIVSTTSYMCMVKNKRKKEIETFLNQPMVNNNDTV